MKRGNENAQMRSEEVERLNDEESADAGVFGAFYVVISQQPSIIDVHHLPIHLLKHFLFDLLPA